MPMRSFALAILRIATAANLLTLAGCTDTVVFGAQREIDVAISVNEDVAQPVAVNIGLNSQIAALVPAVVNKSESVFPGGGWPRLSHPDGEAASIFSGFRFTSTSMFPTATRKELTYDAQVRSQFASGQAAILLAGNPKAVAKVVQVSGYDFERGPEFISSERLELVAKLNGLLANLPKDRVTALYKNPPTPVNEKIEVMIRALKSEAAGAAYCEENIECQRSVSGIRFSNVETMEELKHWEQEDEGCLDDYRSTAERRTVEPRSTTATRSQESLCGALSALSGGFRESNQDRREVVERRPGVERATSAVDGLRLRSASTVHKKTRENGERADCS